MNVFCYLNEGIVRNEPVFLGTDFALTDFHPRAPASWATLKMYNISTNLIRVIKNLYDKAFRAVPFNSSIEDWFRTTVGVPQRCLVSPTLFNIFLERIITDALEDHEGTVGIGGRAITNQLCWWHRWLIRRGRRTGKISWVSRQSLQSTWRSVPKRSSSWQTTPVASSRDYSKWTEAWDSHKLQVPGLSYNWWGFIVWDTLQDSTDNSSIDHVETSLE